MIHKRYIKDKLMFDKNHKHQLSVFTSHRIAPLKMGVRLLRNGNFVEN